ncbi:DUF4389 domain-containing protein [Rhodococcus sp. T7]|uniref:DUF4389 domain-containing protein n=1 Tax=Rhodococcus sp. T7 TaxID=627444 RepID=UPI00135C1960|nr:DUF4389 domain-containing protein [Rhodococcus sp. T7]KAF0958720.1 hypothetical protein MLGJGCBP_08153 [Rhodococcus sp. T7]
MKPGRTVALVLGCVCALAGFALLCAAVFLGWAYVEQNDNGHLASAAERFRSSANALVSERIDLLDDGEMPRGLSTENVGRVLLRVTSDEPDRPIFVGIGPDDAVDNYLAGVAHTQVTAVEFGPFRPSYREISGDRIPEPPSAQSFWSVAAAGAGTQEVRWDLQPGSWTVVVMNADGSPGISVDVQAGARWNFLGPLALGVLIGAVVLLGAGIALVVTGAIGLGSNGPPPHPVGTSGRVPPPGPPSAPHPARLSGDLDEPLSRWLWLIKWLLALPHFLVLFFLGAGFLVATLVAGVTILCTGRYPRGLFDFNVGVLRWLWRVQFYTYSALGTDRYPPFTLQRTDYPADFDVEYPEHLSRPLVLVKWWLLAIPHYLVLAILVGGWWFGNAATDDGTVSGPWVLGSLLSLLVLVAAIALLFTGRYPRPLFDLVIGINRWAYRVIVYAALLRDEYPPFRLDQGPQEPPQPILPRDQSRAGNQP